MRAFPKARLHDDDGAAVVEMGLVILPFLMLVGIIVACGMALTIQSSLSNAAREGVRVWALEGLEPSTAVASYSAIGPVTVTRGLMAGTAESPGAVCVPATAAAAPAPVNAYVRVSRTFVFQVPLVGNTSFALAGRGIMRCGG